MIGHPHQVQSHPFLNKLGLAGAKSSEEEIPHGDHLSHSLLPQLSCCLPSAQLFKIAEDLFTAGLSELNLVFLRPERRFSV
jgi:hypothetical protein